MSDVTQGPGWWQANDGKWYPPQGPPGPSPPTPVAFRDLVPIWLVVAAGALVIAWPLTCSWVC